MYTISDLISLVSKPTTGLSSPPLSWMQPEDSAALRLQTSHLQGFNQATVQSHTWSHVYLKDKKKGQKNTYYSINSSLVCKDVSSSICF